MDVLRQKLPFILNPELRLNTPYFKIYWHLIDFHILQTEASFEFPGRQVLFYNKQYELLVQYGQGQLDIIYSQQTHWDTLKIQRWLRIVIRNSIIERAKEVLPVRAHYWEQTKDLYAGKITVSMSLRKNVMGNCSWKKEIRLAPIIVLFPQQYMDEVILHEMAHLKFMHHRKSFWQYLSILLGKDARQSQKESTLFFSRYADLFYFIIKK